MSIPNNILDGIQKLEPLPITAQKLMEELGKPDANAKEIVRIIEYDGAIAANILRAANSPLYAGRFPIQHLRDAVARLGLVKLLDIALGDHFRRLKFNGPNYDLSENDLWLHGVSASLAVKAMIKETGTGKIPEISSIAALMHDIGKLIMARYLSAEVSRVISLCANKKIFWVDAEKELFGFDHAEVGSAIAQKWSLPKPITRSIGEHHRRSIPDPIPMLDAVMLGDLVAKSVGIGLGAADLNTGINYTECRERIGLTMEGFERVCLQTAAGLQEFRREYSDIQMKSAAAIRS